MIYNTKNRSSDKEKQQSQKEKRPVLMLIFSAENQSRD